MNRLEQYQRYLKPQSFGNLTTFNILLPNNSILMLAFFYSLYKMMATLHPIF